MDPAGVLAHRGPTGCVAAPALKYVQAAKPEPVSQVSVPVTCGVTGEPAHENEAGPLLCGSGFALESKAASVVIRDLVSMEVVPVPRVFTVDPVGVNSAPAVVNPRCTGCVLATTGKKLKVGH